MHIACAVLSRRRLPRSSSPPPPSPSPSPSSSTPVPRRHHHRHRHRHPPRSSTSGDHDKLLSPKTRATEVTNSTGETSSRYPADEAYGYAMAARARLHARLREGPTLLFSTSRSSSNGLSIEQAGTPSPKGSKITTDTNLSLLHGQSATSKDSKYHPAINIKKGVSEKLLCSKDFKQNEDVLSQSDVCSICLEGLPAGRILLCFPCKHRFHRDCLLAWLQGHLDCPNCRSIIIKVGNFHASVVYFNTLYTTCAEDLTSRMNPHSYNLRTETSTS